jgi:Carboxypeptidase regulatory-like domain
MRISTIAVAAIALMLMGANANAQSESAAKPRAGDKPDQNSSSIVRGRAVYEDTGQPAPRERIQLVATELLANRRGPTRIPTTMTDGNGEFIFLHPGAGEFYVVAHPADAHVSSAEAAPFPLQNGDPVADTAGLEQYKRDFPRITVNGEGSVEINLRVKNPHFGSISGRITNTNGVVVAGANVHAMKTGERGFGAFTIADENGTYLFRGLPAGEYLVSADPPRKMPGPGGPQSLEGVLGSTYFPSTINPRTSPPVIVSPDGEVADINITLAPRSLHSVAGTVRAEGDGHPVAGATVRLNKKDADQAYGDRTSSGIEGAMSNSFSTTDAQGRWFFSNLPDGAYTISVEPTARVDAKLERFVDKRQDLTVAGADIENLAIEVSLGGRVSGHVTIEQRNLPAPDISIGIGSAITRVEADGTFTATGVSAGEFPLSVMIRPQNVFYPKSIEVNGVDLLREKLTTGTGAEIKDVNVVLAPASILTGRVLSASGREPLSQVFVMLIPADPSTAPAFARPNGSTNEQGTFLVSGAPGEYFVVLWRRGEPLPPHDVDSIRKLSPNATRVTLGPGERKSLDLTSN